MRARELGVSIGEGSTGPENAITDVDGVRVGHTTLIEGDGPLVVGSGPVRTGVTVVVPCDEVGEAPVFAGSHRLNGNGEMTGLAWFASPHATNPVGLTNTHSVASSRRARRSGCRTPRAGDDDIGAAGRRRDVWRHAQRHKRHARAGPPRGRGTRCRDGEALSPRGNVGGAPA